MTYFLAFGASFLFVFLKAWQQQNITHKHYPWILPTSYGMATCEVYVMYTVSKNGWNIGAVAAIGTGAGLGAMLATYLHSRFLQKEGK